jgi:hypothetical protein
VFSSDGSVDGDETYGDMTFEVYCADFSEVLGCTDINASNYDEDATLDDGSCALYCVEGEGTLYSMDMTSDQWADGTYGATYTISLDGEVVASGPEDTGNWATSSDEFCFVDGCYEVSVSEHQFGGTYPVEYYSWTFNGVVFGMGTSGLVSVGENSCGVLGCTDETAFNYNPEATADDDSCEAVAFGCIDPAAENFDPNANTSDDSCVFCDPADQFTLTMFDAWSDSWNGGVLTMTDGDYSVSTSLVTGLASATELLCLPVGCYELVVGGGTYDSEITFSIDGLIDVSPAGTYSSIEVGDGCAVYGCTDDDYIEFDPLANTDDESCVTLIVEGCTDDTFVEYNPDANVEDGSCVTLAVLGCTDGAADNYEPNANVDDQSCTYCASFVASINDDFSVFDVTSADATNGVVNAAATGGSNNTSFLVYNADGMVQNAGGLGVGTYDVVVLDETLGCSETLSVTINFPGCTDDAATNYVEGATSDDGSCEYAPVPGCTDAAAANFVDGATEDDGSCMYATTFNVDMCNVENVTGVYVSGPFCGWCGNDGYNTMTDDDGDGIYTAELWFAANTAPIEYTYFLNGTSENLVDDMASGGTCASVTDYWSYANRLTENTAYGIEVNDVYGTCFTCEDVIGCMDPDATNYNPLATIQDGTNAGACIMPSVATIEFTVDMNGLDQPSAGYASVVVNGSWNGWLGWGFTLADADEDGIFTGSLELAPGTEFEYVVAVTGSADGYSGWGIQYGDCSADNANFSVTAGEGESITSSIATVFCEVYGCTDPNAYNYDANANTDDDSCEAVVSGCTDPNAYNYDANANTDDESCIAVVSGCTDSEATNYNMFANTDDGSCQLEGCTDPAYVEYDSNANVDDGSCVTLINSTTNATILACNIIPTGLFVDGIIDQRVSFNWDSPSILPSHYMIKYRAAGSNSWTVISAGPTGPAEYAGTTRTRWFMEAGTTYQWAIRARVLTQEGATNCQSAWSATSEFTTLPECANLENLTVSDVQSNWVTFNADAPSEVWGVWQSKGKLRELGTSTYRYVIGDSDGAIDVLKGNFIPSTSYEWHTKAWCTGNVDDAGNSDPMYHSGWGEFSGFETGAICDANPTNLTTSTNSNQNQVIMSWEAPESGAPDHYFLELTNMTTNEVWEWNDIAGDATSETKFNQTLGHEYSWRIRGACGSNGTSWATAFSNPVFFILGTERIGADVVANLDVFPNPSKDIFNVSFTSEEVQTMSVKVVNMIGEEIYAESLSEFVGQYTKVIDMNAQPKGVYFLQINTAEGGINQKIVLQ